jgi:hypothetical protein
MKKLNLISILFVGLVMASTSVYATDLRTQFENYQIQKVDDLYVDNVAHDVWTVNYGTGENPVSVIKCKTEKGAEYVVRSRFFAVCYINSDNGFGARIAKGDLNNVPRSINNVVINSNQLKNQQIISAEKVDDAHALKLIASYLPDLINENYTHVLN